MARGPLTGRYQTRIFAAFDGEISLRDRSQARLKKGPGDVLHVSGTYPHDPALRWFMGQGVAAFPERACGHAACAPARRVLASPQGESAGRRPRIVHLRTSEAARAGFACPLHSRSPLSEAHRPGAHIDPRGACKLQRRLPVNLRGDK